MTIVGDSAQFSAAVTELADQRYVGTALALQLGIGFGLTVVALWLVPLFAAWIGGWRWAFLLLVPGPVVGAAAMLALRRRPGGHGARRRPALGLRPMRSSLEIHDLGSGESRVVHATDRLIEAPNWSPDGRFLVFNGDGRLYRLDLDGEAEPRAIDTGFATRCNNDHGISPDGRNSSSATRPRPALVHLHAAGHRRHAEPRHREDAVLLARLVARRHDARLLRRAQR